MKGKQFITMKIGKTTKPLTCLSYVNCVTGNQVVDKPSVLIKLFLLTNESEMIKAEGAHPFLQLLMS